MTTVILARLPALLVAIAFGGLYFLLPVEISDVVYDLDNRSTYMVLMVFLPLLVVAVQQSAYIGARDRFHIIADAVLLTIPFVAVDLIVLKSDATVDWVSTVCCVAVFGTVAFTGWTFKAAPRLALLSLSIAIGVFYLSVLVSVLLAPVTVPRNIGSFAIVTLAAGFYAGTLSVLLYRPRIGLPLMLVFALVATFDPSRHVIAFVKTNSAGGSPSLTFSDGLSQWLGHRKDLDAYRAAGKPYPVYIVAAEGGGIFAASNAYLQLERMAEVCPDFPQHVFLAVGVSGGSLGVSLFQAKSNQDPQIEGTARCAPIPHMLPSNTPEIRDTELIGDETPVLSDHLAPLLASFLFVESLDAILPGRWFSLDRGTALEESFKLSLDGAGASFSRNFLSHWSAASRGPALALVATDIVSGNRFAFSPFRPQRTLILNNDTTWYSDWADGEDLPWASAISSSARFPWLTPTADLGGAVLADGGYFDNSGVDAVMEVLDEIGRSHDGVYGDSNDGGCEFGTGFDWNSEGNSCAAPIDVKVIVIGTHGADGGPEASAPPFHQSFLFDPFAALLTTREARGRIAVQRAERALCGLSPCNANGIQTDQTLFEFYIRRDLLDLPLSWKLSREKMGRMSAQIGRTVDCAPLAGEVDDDSESQDYVSASAKPRSTSHDSQQPQSIDVQDTLLTDRAFQGCEVAVLMGLLNPADDPNHYSLQAIYQHGE